MIKKSISLCLSVVLVLSLCFCLPINSNAQTSINSQDVSEYSFYTYETNSAIVYKSTNGYTRTVIYPEESLSDNCKITNLKSNRSGVWLRKFGHYFTINSQSFTGTAKITYKVNGKSQTFKYTVKKYANPCKSFKIGSTDYAKKFNSKTSLYSFRNIKNQKLTIKANSGWVITNVYTCSNRYNGKTNYNSYYPYRSSFTKSNVTLSSNGYSYVYVIFKNINNGAENILLYLVR